MVAWPRGTISKLNNHGLNATQPERRSNAVGSNTTGESHGGLGNVSARGVGASSFLPERSRTRTTRTDN